MSRSIQTIQNTILSQIQSNPVLSSLNSTSQTAIYNMWVYIVAVIQNQEEILYDDFTTGVEQIIDYLPPANNLWIQQQAFNFQYSSTTPQIVQFSTASFAPYYPIVNTALQIITNCSITSPNPGYVLVKVATGLTGSAPQALTTQQLQAFQNYMNLVKPDGIIYNCVSLPADLLYSQFTITAAGAYSSVLPNALLTAYNNYLQNIPFNGTIKFVDVLIALRQVAGVIDIVCNNMWARNNSQAFGTGVQMVSNNLVNVLEYTSSAGYIIGEANPNDLISNLTINYI